MSPPGIVRQDPLRRLRRNPTPDLRQVSEEERRQPDQGDLVGSPDLEEEPVREPEKGGKGALPAGPDQGGGAGEVPAVSDQVPIPGKPPHPLHLPERDQPGLKHLVGWVRAVDHPPLGVVPDDWGAPKPLENPDLDLLRLKPQQTIKPPAETLEILARKPDDQVGMDVNAGLGPKESEILLQPGERLSSADQLGAQRVKGLDSNLELHRSGRKPGDDLPQLRREPVRDHFKMVEPPLDMALEEVAQQGAACLEVEVEGSVDELEPGEPPVHETLELGQKGLQRELAHRDIEA